MSELHETDFRLIIIALACVAWLGWWLIDVYRWRRAARWSSTTGRIVAARTIIWNFRRPSLGNEIVSFLAKDKGPVDRQRIPTVEYTVNGQAYSVEGVHAISNMHYRFLKQPLPTRRGEIEVFYDPANVTHAVLARDVNVRFWVIPLFPVAVLAIVLALVP